MLSCGTLFPLCQGMARQGWARQGRYAQENLASAGFLFA
jgi:hypothetical protein